MSEYNIDMNDNRSRVEIMNLVNSFEQLNLRISDLDEVSLHEYIDLSHKIPYDHEILKLSYDPSSHWLFSCIKQLIEISDIDPRAFRLSLNDMTYLGFDIYEFNSKLPHWCQLLTKCIDDDLKRQKRFLAKNKLIENIDYVESIEDINGEFLTTGFKLNRHAVCSLIVRKYGQNFLMQITMRVSQILSYYDRYKQDYRYNRIETLQRTIIGLSEDINELMQKRNKDSYADDRYSSCSQLSSSVIMDNPDYSDELTTIHNIIESSINRMDGRISDIHLKLADLTNKIDDLTSSIVMNLDESRNSKSTLYSETQSRTRSESNPILNHVNSIFNEFRELNGSYTTYDSPNRQFRYTCIGNESHL